MEGDWTNRQCVSHLELVLLASDSLRLPVVVSNHKGLLSQSGAEQKHVIH